ncbi:hypothetical protein B4589_006675 [Halolamina sp. CBA1230]|uniref:hypothetical protein n=1 Tax=Halolamina sp. CBA1230 TaxID=1853690 RepID=UPI0009A1CB05|nr:hypothetical protein [Halolamina sp. CBA1230]QKY20077.1 hypothetical protein B4589_006675 [Halolamina sp. CBA1230]
MSEDARVFDPEALVVALDRFGGSEPERRTVARQAADLADSGRYRRDSGRALTPDLIVDELADAPDGSPADRWNWWIGVLAVAYGGYEGFAVRRYPGAADDA